VAKYDDVTRSVAMTAKAQLPGLDIEIVHRRSSDEDAEEISITLKAVPSFEAFGRYLETAHPFFFWAQAMQLAWLPWLQAARSMSVPEIPQIAKPRAER
jgi:hypothetical protein